MTGYTNIDMGDMDYGDASLAIAVRLVDKKTKEVVWGNIYYKPLIKHAFANHVKIELDNMVNDLYASSTEDKLNFITKPETITKREFKTYPFIDAYLSNYMQNLQHQDRLVEIDTAVSLNGRFPKDALLEVNEVYNSLNETHERHM